MTLLPVLRKKGEYDAHLQAGRKGRSFYWKASLERTRGWYYRASVR